MSRRWVGNLLLILAGGLIGLVMLEGGLRLADISYPYFYITDPIVGYSHKPHAEGWWKKEGLAYIRINSEGFRDREHTKEKPLGRFESPSSETRIRKRYKYH